MKAFVLIMAAVLLVGCGGSETVAAPVIPEGLPQGCNLSVKGSDYVLEQYGIPYRYKSLQGEKLFVDYYGIDWGVAEECNAVLLFNIPRQGDELQSYILFAPEGFPLNEVYKEPWMGAKKLKVAAGPGSLIFRLDDGRQLGN